jgi:hypothetical protein
MCSGTLSFSAQCVWPYAGGLATMASATKGTSECSGSGSVHAPHVLNRICLTWGVGGWGAVGVGRGGVEERQCARAVRVCCTGLLHPEFSEGGGESPSLKPGLEG